MLLEVLSGEKIRVGVVKHGNFFVQTVLLTFEIQEIYRHTDGKNKTRIFL